MIWRMLIQRRGDRGEAVEALQLALRQAGHNPGEIDGVFGPLTEAAVRDLQRRFGVPETGVYGIREVRLLAGASMVHSGETEAARAFLRGFGVAGVMDSPMVGHLARLLVDAHAGDAAAFAARDPSDVMHIIDVHPVNAWVAWVAERMERIGIHEQRQNRGPMVDPIIRVGGGNPEDAPPWCAYFVAFVRRVAVWLWSEVVGDGARFAFPVSGGAARTWLEAGADALPHDDWPPIGAAYHRTRTGQPEWHAQTVREAREGMPGHTGIVTGYDLDGERILLCVGGNSSGAGHSTRSRSGRVAREVLGHSDSNEQARAAFRRLVGFTIITAEDA